MIALSRFDLKAGLANLDEFRFLFVLRRRIDPAVLRSAPMINVGDLVYAGNRAIWRARFFRQELMVEMLARVFRERNSRPSPLLGAVMNQPVFAHVDVT